MNAAETSASSAIADWTPLAVVSQVVHDGRDRDVHQRRVDDEHEHRHREQDRDEVVAARLLGRRRGDGYGVTRHAATAEGCRPKRPSHLATFRERRREARGPDDDPGADRDPEVDGEDDSEAAVVPGIEIDPELHDKARDHHQRDEADGGEGGAGQEVPGRDLLVRQQPRHDDEEQHQESDPGDTEHDLDDGGARVEVVQLHQQQQEQPVEAGEDGAVAELVGHAGLEVELPRPRVDELEDMAEPDSEHQCADDREQCRPELVRAPLSEHVVDQLRGRRVEPVVMDERVRQRVRMRVEVLLHDQHRRKDGYQDVEGQKRCLQRPFHGPVTPPRTERDPATRARVLPLDPVLRSLRGSTKLGSHPRHSCNLALPTRGLNHPARTILRWGLARGEAVPTPEVGKPLRREVALVLDPQPLVGHVRPPGCREQENHHVGITAADVERGREAVQLRHVQVEQHEVRVEHVDEGESFTARRRVTETSKPGVAATTAHMTLRNTSLSSTTSTRTVVWSEAATRPTVPSRSCAIAGRSWITSRSELAPGSLKPLGPHRLAVQVAALSRLKHGFESRWGY